MEQEFLRTILDWVEDLTQSIWNVCINFDRWKEHWKLSVLEETNVVLNRKKCW